MRESSADAPMRGARLGLARLFGEAVLANAIIFCAVALTYGIVFDSIDDYNVMMSLCGDKTGRTYAELTFFNSAFAYLMSGLYALYAGVQWYSLIEILMCLLSLSVILCSLWRLCVARGLSRLLALLAYGASVLACYLYAIQRLQFTATAALAGAAACACLYSLDQQSVDSGCFAPLTVTSVVCLAASLVERRPVGLCCSAFYAVGCVRAVLCWRRGTLRVARAEARDALRRALVVGLACAVMLVAGHMIPRLGDNAAYMDYNSWRIRFQDHPHPSYADARELYQSVGWSKEVYQMAKRLVFIDERIGAEAFEAISTSPEAAQALEQVDAVGLARNVVWNNPSGKAITLALFSWLTFAMCVVLPKLVSGGAGKTLGKGTRLDAVVLLVAFVLGVALIAMVCSAGRWLLRAYQAVAFPLLAVLMVLGLGLCGSDGPMAVAGKADGGTSSLGWPLLLLGLLLGWSCYLGKNSVQQISFERDADSLARNAAIEAYAIEHPDSVFVHDFTVCNSCAYDPFRTYEEGGPTNLIISGGSYTYSGCYYSQLQANGLEELDGTTLLGEDVFYISNTEVSDLHEDVLAYLTTLDARVQEHTVCELGYGVEVLSYSL